MAELIQQLTDAYQLAPSDLTIKWMLIIGVAFLCITLISYEQRKMRRYYQRLVSHASSQDTAAIDYALQLLSISARNRLLFAVAFLLLSFSVVFYDMKQLHQANDLMVHCEDTAQGNAPQPVTVVKADNDTDVLERQLDSLKRDYEQAFINYYLLESCNQASVKDALVISGALTHELSLMQAPASLVKNIRESAQSTYQELYADFDCASSDLAPIVQRHQQYVTSIVSNLSEHIN